MLVFPTAGGKPESPSNVRNRFLSKAVKRASEALLEAGGQPMNGVSPHSLRRTFISLLLAAGADVLDLMADGLDLRRRPRIPVPLITPWLSSLWIGLVTPVDAGVARPLVEGLSTPTVVTDRSGADLFEITPIPVYGGASKGARRGPGGGDRAGVDSHRSHAASLSPNRVGEP